MKKFLALLCTAAMLVSIAGSNKSAETTTTASADTSDLTVTEADTTTLADPATATDAPVTEETIEIPEDSEYVIENGITERM
ncbi:MAG: hypothetical protein IJZ65_04515, partial [Ruminiclostridium sp.]|nr:hypothetical protein [Ruminiclostridium sp.]